MRHVDCIYYDFVKHGWVTRPVYGSHSTLHGYIERGTVVSNWDGQISDGEGGYDRQGDVGLHFIQPNLPSCNEDIREKNREQKMEMTIWFEKFLPKAESGVQNGIFLQCRWAAYIPPLPQFA